MPRVVKTKHIMALNFYPIFMPLNQRVEKILDFFDSFVFYQIRSQEVFCDTDL